ncbi:MAG: response regulator [Candidatus Eisenbacteria sp.]|nr:response regulator [Candidatus Eisenbacteria bacterium]
MGARKPSKTPPKGTPKRAAARKSLGRKRLQRNTPADSHPFDILRTAPTTELEACCRALFDAARDIMVVVDGHVVVECNQAALRMLGLPLEQIVGKTLDNFCRAADPGIPGWAERLSARLARARPGESQVFECRWSQSDGPSFPAEVSFCGFEVKGRVMFLMTIRDITGRTNLEEEVRQSQKMEAIARLAGGVAHDFNNLLTAINGHSTMLLDSMAPDDPGRPDVEQILKAGMSAANLTHRLLAISCPRSSDARVLNLNDVLKGVGRMLKPILGEGIQVVVRLAPDLGNTRADPHHVEQIITDLAANARDAMPGGGTLTIETANVEMGEGDSGYHAGPPPGAGVMLSVSDTGTGMEEEIRTRAFEPFFTTMEKGKRKGLGLSIVYAMVKQCGGNISLSSEPGHGTCLKIYLPRVHAAPEPVSRPDPVEETPGGTETILVVEDEDTVRSLAARILERLGYTVIEAASGPEAIEAVKRWGKPIDLALCDVIMLGMSGPEFARELRKIHPDFRILYMSGYPKPDIAHYGVFEEGVHFIDKPFTAHALSLGVREALTVDE